MLLDIGLSRKARCICRGGGARGVRSAGGILVPPGLWDTVACPSWPTGTGCLWDELEYDGRWIDDSDLASVG